MSKSIFSKIKGLIFASIIFWILFILHIIFASNNLWFLFNIVAILIFFTSHFHSFIALKCFKLENKDDKMILIYLSTFFSIFYSIGYWYAVNQMVFEIWILFMGLIPIMISILIARYLITDN
ncbi:MAG: hypothetical protein CMA03_05775 [Euryarchaeota archaeon]|nr:hypothetical protein [Euryarchaeota archaeon]